MPDRALNFLTHRLIATLTVSVALAAAVACGSTAPTDTSAAGSANRPAPTAPPEAAAAVSQTADRGEYGGGVPMRDYASPT